MPICRQPFRRGRRPSRGAAAVEFAFVAPVFLLLVFGILEFGRAVMLHQMLTNGARECARYAIVPGRTDEQFDEKFTAYLQAAFPEKTEQEIADQFAWDIEPDLSDAVSGDELLVSVQIPFNSVSWGVQFFMPDSAVMGSQVTMRKE